MKELLLLCTKKVHFTFNGKIYMQVHSVAVGSPLGPVLGDIFMIELEKAILPEITECIKYWKRYIDDTISFAKLGTISYIITQLNSFDNNIQFNFEEEKVLIRCSATANKTNTNGKKNISYLYHIKVKMDTMSLSS